MPRGARQPVPYAPPAAYYDYDEPQAPRRLAVDRRVPVRRRRASIGGFFLYDQIQDQLSGSKTVAVGNYVGIREADAVKKIRDIGLKPNPVRRPNRDVVETYVFAQTPKPGERTQKSNFVTIYVSTGPPETWCRASSGSRWTRRSRTSRKRS